MARPMEEVPQSTEMSVYSLRERDSCDSEPFFYSFNMKSVHVMSKRKPNVHLSSKVMV